MSRQKGSTTKIVVAFETTYKTDPSPKAGLQVPVNSFSLDANEEAITPATLQGRRDAAKPYRGNIDVKGSAVIPLDDTLIGIWLRAMFGSAISVVTGAVTAAAVTADAGTNVITHTTHGLLDGQGVILGGTAVPGGTVAGTVYFLRDKTTSSYKLAASPGGAAIDLTDAGTSVTVTAVPAHVFRVGSTMPSLVCEQQFTDLAVAKYYKYNGVKIGSLKLAFGGSGELVASLSLVGATETLGSAAYDSSQTVKTLGTRYSFKHVSVKEGGVACTTLKSLDLTIDFGLDEDGFALDATGQRSTLDEGSLTISGSIKGFFVDTALAEKGAAGTETSLEITLAIDGTHKLIIDLPEVEFSRVKKPVDGPKGLYLDQTFQAFYQDASPDKTSVQITLVNAQATAY